MLLSASTASFRQYSIFPPVFVSEEPICLEKRKRRLRDVTARDITVCGLTPEFSLRVLFRAAVACNNCGGNDAIFCSICRAHGSESVGEFQNFDHGVHAHLRRTVRGLLAFSPLSSMLSLLNPRPIDTQSIIIWSL